MATTSTFLTDLAVRYKEQPNIRPSDFCAVALFGANKKYFQMYDPSKKYKRGDKIPYITENGELIMIVALEDVTGPFNPMLWEEWSVMSELEGILYDHIVLSWDQPSLRRNKVWIQIKDEEINDIPSRALGTSTGVLVYRNFVIGERRPTMTAGTIWGQVTDVADQS
jgi:hypothetical protein